MPAACEPAGISGSLALIANISPASVQLVQQARPPLNSLTTHGGAEGQEVIRLQELDSTDKRILGALDEDQRARLLDIANRCPVHRTLTSVTTIRTQLT